MLATDLAIKTWDDTQIAETIILQPSCLERSDFSRYYLMLRQLELQNFKQIHPTCERNEGVRFGHFGGKTLILHHFWQNQRNLTPSSRSHTSSISPKTWYPSLIIIRYYLEKSERSRQLRYRIIVSAIWVSSKTDWIFDGHIHCKHSSTPANSGYS